MNEQYVEILEAEVQALRTRLEHVMRWVYRDHMLRADLSEETVDLMIRTYIASYEADQQSERHQLP
jgi:hypothetical protein